jgi:hypothetical protein
MTKYRLTLNDLERKGGIERLQRDGFTREQISKTLYKETDGASQDFRTKVMTDLHIREQKK